MEEPRWLTSVHVRMLHTETLRLFGGRPGLRDLNLLESALARPQHVFGYREDADLADLAAAYAFGLARNHAFVDGNKRAARAGPGRDGDSFRAVGGWRAQARRNR